VFEVDAAGTEKGSGIEMRLFATTTDAFSIRRESNA